MNNNPLNISNEFGEYYEQNEDVFYMMEHDHIKKIIELCYAPENIEIKMRYDDSGKINQSNIPYQLRIKSMPNLLSE